MTRRWPFPRLAFRRSGREGDRHFADRILPHLDAAWNYARYLTRDADLAEDVVQEAFLRALRAQEACRGDGKAWLMSIVRNCWHDWLRRHRPEAGRGQAEDALADSETPHSLLERKGEADRLRGVIAALPEPFREAVVLRDLEELSYREIAAITAAPLGTVMSRIARARAMLAAVLLGEDENVMQRVPSS